MKNTFLKTIGTAALAILMTVIFAQIRVSAQDISDNEQTETQKQVETQKPENPFRNIGATSLEGTWDVQVTIRNCQTGAPIRTFPELTTFMSGGTLIGSTSATPQALKTPGHGVWSQEFGNRFRYSSKFFNFDANGNYTGYTIIRQQVNQIFTRFLPEYESSGTAQGYAPNGNLVFTGCSTTTATLFGG